MGESITNYMGKMISVEELPRRQTIVRHSFITFERGRVYQSQGKIFAHEINGVFYIFEDALNDTQAEYLEEFTQTPLHLIKEAVKQQDSNFHLIVELDSITEATTSETLSEDKEHIV